MHTNSKEDIAEKLGFANEFSDFRDLKMFNPWFGLEHKTLRQLYSTPLRIGETIERAHLKILVMRVLRQFMVPCVKSYACSNA